MTAAFGLRAKKPGFIQINFSLERREVGEGLLPHAADRSIGVINYRAFAWGRIFPAGQ